MAENFHLGVWRSEVPLSDKEASEQYAALSAGPDACKFDSAVYAFHSQLIGMYPELDMLSDSEAELSPWASSPDFSGVHVAIALRPTHDAEVLPVILQLADLSGLVCFESQNLKVYLQCRWEDKGGHEEASTSRTDIHEGGKTPEAEPVASAAITSAHGQPKSGRDSFLEGIVLLTLAPLGYWFLPATTVLLVMGLGFLLSTVSLLGLAQPFRK